MYRLWLAWRYFKSGNKYFGLTSFLAVLGLIIGVAGLVTGMGAFSGYETTLKKAVIDKSGHLIMRSYRSDFSDHPQVVEKIKKELKSDFKSATPFLYLEGIIAHKKQVSGVLVEGVDPLSVNKVVNIQSVLQKGSATLAMRKGASSALIGKGIASRFGLSVGDEFKIVIPINDSYDSESFRPRAWKFYVEGILNLGRHDYDNRFVLTDLQSAQTFAQVKDHVTGLRLLLSDADIAQSVQFKLMQSFQDYDFMYWKEFDRNLFQAVMYEKLVMFFVLLILVVAASFNVSSSLFVNVIQRYQDIGILKAIGAKPRTILSVFAMQGLLIGIVGASLGVGLGLLGCWGFSELQNWFEIIPKEVYKLDKIEVDIRTFDLVVIILVSLIISFVSTLIPALRGSRLQPTEGLKYE